MHWSALVALCSVGTARAFSANGEKERYAYRVKVGWCPVPAENHQYLLDQGTALQGRGLERTRSGLRPGPQQPSPCLHCSSGWTESPLNREPKPLCHFSFTCLSSRLLSSVPCLPYSFCCPSNTSLQRNQPTDPELCKLLRLPH